MKAPRKRIKYFQYFILCSVLFSTMAYTADKKSRKVSSQYYDCIVERKSSTGITDKDFSDDYHFPAPTLGEAPYNLKFNLRWMDFSMKVAAEGKVKILINENIDGEVKSVEKSIEFKQSTETISPFSAKLFLTQEKIDDITYSVVCK